MKIAGLIAENIKRLTVVEINPEGNLVTIGGKNGSGKSSVLDAIAWALGGKDLVPSEPIRKGESFAKIELDLGEFIVTRKFNRDKIDVSVHGKPDQWIWGETKSSLSVRNKEGASYASPQAMLDKLLGKLTFDPLKFAQERADAQARIIRDLVGLDFTALDAQKKAAYDKRTELNRQVKAKKAVLDALPQHQGVPAEESSMDQVSQEMLRAETLRKTRDDIVRKVTSSENRVANTKRLAEEIFDRAIMLERQFRDTQALLEKTREELAGEQKLLESIHKEAKEAEDKVPNVDTLRQRVSEIEETNRKVRENKAHAAAAEELSRLNGRVAVLSTEIAEVEQKKQASLEEAEFPIAGLGLTDEGLTFNGVPFEQASTAEQLRTSVAIGLALNPKLKVLLVRNGNALDAESMQIVAKMAEKADAQVWMEYVTQDAGKVEVMLEEGHVA
jgi:DNA repair exonuclease SbcCD ATPase subunit